MQDLLGGLNCMHAMIDAVARPLTEFLKKRGAGDSDTFISRLYCFVNFVLTYYFIEKELFELKYRSNITGGGGLPL